MDSVASQIVCVILKIMKSAMIRLAALVAIAAVSPFTFGASADRKQAQGQILEQNGFACSNCFFGPSDHYFCIATDNKVILAHAKIPTFNWRDQKRNYFGKVYSPWKEPDVTGQSVNVQYDDKYVWIARADGKQIRLKQDYSRDIFVNNQQCRAAVKK